MIEKLFLSIVAIASLASLIYNIVSSYAIRGNELKHLKNEIVSLGNGITQVETRVCEKIDDAVERIERLENRIFENKEK